MKAYMLHVLIALDQLVNALLGGAADETLSARAYRAEANGRLAGRMLRPVIDGLFSPWERDHCRAAWRSEVTRQQLPGSYR